MSRYEYVRDPEAIYGLSAERVAAATDVSGLPADLATPRLPAGPCLRDARRRRRPSLAGVAGRRRRAGASCRRPRAGDCEMVARGVNRHRLPAGNTVFCSLNDPRVREIQQRERTTRSAAAVELWREHLQGSVVAIGNAPTALFRLMEVLADTPGRLPAAILAFPVGFVGGGGNRSSRWWRPASPSPT